MLPGDTYDYSFLWNIPVKIMVFDTLLFCMDWASGPDIFPPVGGMVEAWLVHCEDSVFLQHDNTCRGYFDPFCDEIEG